MGEGRRPLAIDDVRYGREGWTKDTLFVGTSRDGSDDVELTSPLQIIRLDPKQAHLLLDELMDLEHKRTEKELRLHGSG